MSKRLLEAAREVGILPAAATVEMATDRMRRLPLVHRLKHADISTVQSILTDGLKSAAARGDESRWKWRLAAGTSDDVFFAVGSLTFASGPGVVLLLDPGAWIADGRTTPWDSGAPKHAFAGDLARALTVFTDNDAPRPEGLAYQGFLAAGCFESVSDHPWVAPVRRDPPGVLGCTKQHPSWVPEVRRQGPVPVRDHVIGVVASPEAWGGVGEARAMLFELVSSRQGVWVEEPTADFFGLVERVVRGVLDQDDGGW